MKKSFLFGDNGLYFPGDSDIVSALGSIRCDSHGM